MKKLVIFDLDGTLFNTTMAMAACGNYALEHLGMMPLAPEKYARFSGGSVKAFICSVLSAAGDKECENYDAFWRLYLEKNSSLTERDNVPYEGIEVVLSKLKRLGVRLAVLSNKDEASCIPIVENAFGKGFFDRIFGGKEGVPAKPDPTVAFALMKEFDLCAEECLYIGDTEIDMQTGNNAGLDTVAALWGYREREELECFSPAYLFEKPLDILSLFEEI